MHIGNPSDSDPLAPAFEGHVQVVNRTPGVVATDRGFGSKANETLLSARGVKRVSLPYKGRLGAAMGEHPAEARSILQKLIGEVTLKPNHKGLEAILRGNLPGILDLDRYCTIGAGSPSQTLPTLPTDCIIVA